MPKIGEETKRKEWKRHRTRSTQLTASLGQTGAQGSGQGGSASFWLPPGSLRNTGRKSRTTLCKEEQMRRPVGRAAERPGNRGRGSGTASQQLSGPGDRVCDWQRHRQAAPQSRRTGSCPVRVTQGLPARQGGRKGDRSSRPLSRHLSREGRRPLPCTPCPARLPGGGLAAAVPGPLPYTVGGQRALWGQRAASATRLGIALF